MWESFFFVYFLFILVESNERPSLQQFLLPQNLKENQILKLNCELVEGKLPVVYKWFFNKKMIENNSKKKIISKDDSSKLTIYNLTFDDIGEYECKAENSYGDTFSKVSVFLNSKFLH